MLYVKCTSIKPLKFIIIVGAQILIEYLIYFIFSHHPPLQLDPKYLENTDQVPHFFYATL